MRLPFFLVCVFFSACAAQDIQAQKPHHTRDGFRNTDSPHEPGLGDFLKWRWERLWKKTPSPEDARFSLAVNDPAFLKGNRDRITLTWIGHATVLLQLEGKNILTDPHFSQRASPVQWAGPKRLVPPGLAIEDLPPIHLVVISHDHYDSLDRSTILALRGRQGGEETSFLVPQGLKGWFEDLGVRRIVELDWWEEEKVAGLTVLPVPVHHWSKRSPFSRNTTLWAGWVIRSQDFRFFFCGDSGYTPLFEETGKTLGPFDLSAIPIGAYEPRWFMRHHHMSPEEAAQVHLDVGSKKSVAIHWGTFILTDEPLDEPPQRLKKALEERGIPQADFLVLKHGETLILR